MTENQQEAFYAVQKINKELYLKYKKWGIVSDRPILSITFAEHRTFIGLSIPSHSDIDIPEFHLYNSHSKDRIYFEKSGKYESFYKYIKRKFLVIKDEINKVKL